MRSRPRPEAIRRERGFTLLEVLVAFAIAALALSVLFRGALTGLLSADVAGRYEEALSRARSHLAALGWSPVATDLQGDDDGAPSRESDDRRGSSYHWHVRVSPIAAAVRGGGVVGGAPAVRITLYAVSVAVSWQEDGRQRVVELDSERLGTALTSGPGDSGP